MRTKNYYKKNIFLIFNSFIFGGLTFFIERLSYVTTNKDGFNMVPCHQDWCFNCLNFPASKY